ncbi:hypothetical protein SUDANB171_00856 [Streptomyces sp. enrichment culture]|jgi:hypothetical protein|uniref:(2Fe-2S)-binding protein n=1 Tax=Streptomyces xiamenensis TaxID=408015 RepID=UPI0036E63E29
MHVSALAPALPLAPALDRANDVLSTLRFTQEEPRGGPGWVRGSDLAEAGPVLEDFLTWDDERILADYGQRGRPQVVASFALHRYAWPAAVLFTLPYFLLRRVPWLAPEDVAFHRADGLITAAAGTFSCLPDDPLAGHPDARVVADEEALRAAVREAAAAHLGPVLEGFRPRMRRGSRALWGMATDELTESLWYLGSLLGEEERALAEAQLLLPGGTTPYPGGAAFRDLTGPDGAVLRTRDRVSCCLFYTLRPESTCVTCPRMCDSERIERLTAVR